MKKIIFFLVLTFSTFSFSEVISDNLKKELLAKAEEGKLSDEEYEIFVKYGLCKPLKNNFLEDRERGWVYGEFCTKENLTKNYSKKNEVKKEKKKEKKKDRKVGMTGTGGEIVSIKIDRSKVRDDKYLDKLNAKQFRYLIQELMDEATYNPTPENVQDYLYVQDYMGRKALKFARVWQQVILSNPSLGGYGRFKRTQWEEKVYYKEKMNDRKVFFEKLKKEFGKTVGIYVFVKGDCKYCHMEMEAIHNLIADYGISVMAVSSNFCIRKYPNCKVVPKAFKKFNVSVTPTIVLVVKDKNTNKLKYQTIAIGLTSESTLIDRIVYYYKYLTREKHIDDRTIIWGADR